MLIRFRSIGVRWSENQSKHITVNDEHQATVKTYTTDFNSECYVDENGYYYHRILADRPLRNSATSWTLALIRSPGRSTYRFRVGVLPNGAIDGRSVTTICGPDLFYSADDIQTTTKNGDHLTFAAGDHVRYSLAADLWNGIVTATIWTVHDPANVAYWFSVQSSPAVLADSTPVAYIWSVGSKAVLTADSAVDCQRRLLLESSIAPT